MELVDANISDLSGLALDWVVAQFDPMCNGLEWRPVADGRAWAGFGKVNGSVMACAYLSHGSNLSVNMRMRRDGIEPYSPSTNWSQCGRLIEKYQACIEPEAHNGLVGTESSGKWVANIYYNGGDQYTTDPKPSPLIAACEAIIAAEMGEIVQVPDDLLNKRKGGGRERRN